MLTSPSQIRERESWIKVAGQGEAKWFSTRPRGVVSNEIETIGFSVGHCSCDVDMAVFEGPYIWSPIAPMQGFIGA